MTPPADPVLRRLYDSAKRLAALRERMRRAKLLAALLDAATRKPEK